MKPSIDKNKLFMLVFVGSEAFFFIALIISYVYYSHPGGNLSATAKYLDFKKTLIFTFFLLTSSLTIWMAGLNQRKGNRKALIGWLLVTIILGIVFLFGQGSEYERLISSNVTVSQNIFGSAFFTLTGFHGIHVILGLVVLSVMTLVIYSRKFEGVESKALESAAIYWHFVDAVWIVVFSVVYIGAII
ncbi:MAG: heme-copper oxidase subunit III [Ignavibacteriaceae bacterium]